MENEQSFRISKIMLFVLGLGLITFVPFTILVIACALFMILGHSEMLYKYHSLLPITILILSLTWCTSIIISMHNKRLIVNSMGIIIKPAFGNIKPIIRWVDINNIYMESEKNNNIFIEIIIIIIDIIVFIISIFGDYVQTGREQTKYIILDIKTNDISSCKVKLIVDFLDIDESVNCPRKLFSIISDYHLKYGKIN